MVISKKMSLVALTVSLVFGCVPHGVAMRKKPEQTKKDKIVAFFKNNSSTFKNALLVGTGCTAGFMLARYLFKADNTPIAQAPLIENAVDVNAPLPRLDNTIKFGKEFAQHMAPAIIGGVMGATTSIVQWTMIRLFERQIEYFSAPKNTNRTEEVYMNALETAPKEIKELNALLNNKELKDDINDYLPLGYILHGPPGCGKTEIAKAMAQKIGANFQIIKHSDIASGVINMMSANLKYKLDLIKSKLPANGIGIVFIDEIDTIAPQRMPGQEHNAGASEDNKTVNVLLQEIQGFDSQNKRLIIIGATNRIDIIDKAVLSRLTPIAMQAPNYMERKKGLEQQSIKLCDEVFCNELLKLLARETEGFSYRDLSALMRSFGRKMIVGQASDPDSVRVLMECLREEKLNVANRVQSGQDSKPPQSMYS